MQVLPYLLLLLLLPQIQGCKNIKARVVRRLGYVHIAKPNLFEEPEAQQILIQIIKNKFGVTVKKEDLLKMLKKEDDIKKLAKKEIKYDQKIM